MGLPPSGVVATAAPDPELTAMLARAAVSIGLEVNRPPSPEPSRLDDWFLGAGRSSQPRPVPVPFFPEVQEELTKLWMAPFTARSGSSTSSILTTLDDGVARGYAGIPQVERAIAVHLCPRNAATCRNRPRLPSKACKLTATLTAKAYSPAGQAASALHAMAILQARPQSARRHGRPLASSRAAPPQAESTLRPARRASRRRAVPPRVPARPQVVQEVDEVALTRATRRCWSLLFLRRWREQRCSFPRRRAGRRILCFCSAAGPRASGTHFLKKEQFPFPPGSQVHGTTVCDALLPHSRP